MLVLQSGTDSLQVMAGSSSEMFPISSEGIYDVSNIKVEEEDINMPDVNIKVEEEEINMPEFEMVNVKTENVLFSEEEECIDIKDEDALCTEEEEEEEEEDIHTKEEKDIDTKEQVS
jgi:hypothetical protein